MLTVTFPQWDQDLFLYLNGKNYGWLDPVMYAISSHIAWALICLIVIGVLVYKNRYWGIRASVFLVCGLATNSIVNNIVKYIVQRPRPANALPGVHQLGGVDLSYSFFSAHTSNSICLALFATLYFRHKHYGLLIFLWAMVVAYSRVYLGRHYPLDIICGLLFGIITGSMSYWLYKRYYEKKKGLAPQGV